MECLSGMNVVSFPASFVNVQEYRSPVCERVAFPPCMQKRRLVCVAKAAASDDSKNFIRLTIQPESGGKAVEPTQVVIQVPERGAVAESRENVTHVASESAVESPDKVHQQAEHEAEGIASRKGDSVKEVAKDLEHKAEELSEPESDAGSRENVTLVASESAVESPDKVHEQAEVEAKRIASRTGHSVEEVAKDLEHKADELSEAEAEHLKSNGVAEAVNLEELTKSVEETVKAAVEGTFQSGHRARQGLEAAKEAVEKRAKVLAEAAEDATQRGSQVVGAAKRGLEGLKSQLSKAASEFQRNLEEMQREDSVSKLKAVLEEEPQDKSLEKHRGVVSEDVSTDGERTLKAQKRQEHEDSEQVQNH